MAGRADDGKLIKELIQKYGLHPDDAYIHRTKKYKVINRKGYKKIQAIEKIRIKFVLESTNNVDACVIRAIGGKYGSPEWQLIETFGEASPRNSNFIYPHSVAQSRAEGRLVLEAAGLYAQGFLTEDEIDEQFQTDTLVKKREQVGKDSVQETLDKLGIGKDDTKKDTALTQTTTKKNRTKAKTK